MTDILDRAKATLEGVSPGPWRTERSKYVSGSYVITRNNTTAVHATEWGNPGGQEFDTPDFRFAAEARTLVPELIAEVEHLRFAYAHSGDHICDGCWPPEPDDDPT